MGQKRNQTNKRKREVNNLDKSESKQIIKRIDRMSLEENDSKINLIQNNLNKNLAMNPFNLRVDLTNYIIEFIEIEEMLKMVNTNRYIRKIITEKSIFNSFLPVIKILTPKTFFHINYFREDSDKILKTINDIIKKIKIENVPYLLQKILLLYYHAHNKGGLKNAIYFENPTRNMLYYIQLIILSQVSKITSLKLIFNKKEDLNDIDEIIQNLCKIFEQQNSLKSFSLNTIAAEKFVSFFYTLSNNKNLKKLKLNLQFSNEIDIGKTLPQIYESIKRNKSITQIKLKLNDYESRVNNNQNFMNLILTKIELKEVKLEFNCSFEFQDNFYKVIKANKVIEYVSMEGEMNLKEMNKFCEAIVQNPLKKLRFKNISLKSGITLEIAKLIQNNFNITILEIINSECQYSNNYFNKLFEIFSNNNSLKNFRISKYFVRDDEFICLLTNLMKNFTLKCVDVRNSLNIIENSEMIIQMLTKNKTLSSFKFDDKFTNDSILKEFLEMRGIFN